MAKQPTRGFRFTLRALLALMLALAIPLGWWVNSAMKQRAVVRRIAFVGGGVTYDVKTENPLSKLLGRDFFYRVDTVLYFDSTVRDQDLQHLKKLKHLKKLTFINANITDAGLVRIKNVESLLILKLIDTHVTDNGIAEFRKALPNCGIVREQSIRSKGTVE